MTLKELEKRLLATEKELVRTRKRLQVAEDIEEIKQLQYRYLNCVMFAKYNEIIALFAQDCTIQFAKSPETKGRANIEKYFKEIIAKSHVGKEGDFEVHPLITVDGDKAKGNWVMYIMYFYPRTGQSLFWIQGIYDADYVREDGRWKIKYLRWKERLGLPGGGPPTGLC